MPVRQHITQAAVCCIHPAPSLSPCVGDRLLAAALPAAGQQLAAPTAPAAPAAADLDLRCTAKLQTGSHRAPHTKPLLQSIVGQPDVRDAMASTCPTLQSAVATAAGP
jgi:hypothetical protein